MNKHLTLHQTLSAILLFIGIALGQSAFAQTTWSLQPTSSGNTITYKVKRSGDISQAVTVRYRTVGLSSYEGENFTSANGTLTFPAGIDQQTVTVTTQTPSTEAYKYYQSGAARKYLFEVTDMGGFSLVSKEDNAGAGTVFNTSYLNQSVTDLVYFTYNGAIQSGDGNKYVDASHSGSSDWVQVTDGGYDQAVHTISTNSLYNNNSTSNSFRSYLNEIGYNMYATVYFTQKEEQDGYQYIQILADNSSTYDGDDPDGAVNAPSTSIYKASFILSYDPSGSVMSDPHYQFFPHRYNYVDRAAEQTAGISHYEFDYDNSHLYQQRFKATSYQSNTSGSLVLAPTVNNLNVRFDAAGSGGDTWDFKNLKVRLALVDATKPTIRNNNDIRVAEGAYGYGNTVYITIPFTEIVTVTGTPTLSTTWGTLNYIAGSGTNVLTFSGNIQADLGTVLTVNSIGGTSFTIKDLMGNTCNNTSINKTFNGLQVTNPWMGSGTANDPYIIMDRYQLDLLSRLVWSGQWFTNTYFKLGADITYSHSNADTWDKTSSFTSNFTSIGGWGHSFRGVFDGDGHSISGIRIYRSGTANEDQCQGLFGMISTGSTVKNLVLYNANIVGYKQVGGITGSHSSGTIQDCYVYNTRAKASDTQCGIIRGSGSATVTRGYYKDCMVGSNTGQHNIVKLTLNDNATVTRTPVTTLNANTALHNDGLTLSGAEYYTPNIDIALGYSGTVPSGSFVKYTASTSTGDITFTNIDGNVLTMPDADVTVSAAILPVVDYLDADGNAQQCSDYTLITSSNSNVEMGASGKTHWYVVSSDATINAMLKFTDATANLILCNGATLNVNRTNSGSAVFANNLNIFGQTNGNGTLNATVSNGSGISSNALGIYGGIVSASGGDYGINAGGNSITLGYTAAANRVTASSYLCNSLTVKAGQTLTDGEGHLYNGTYSGDDLTTALNAMVTKTLQPAYSITLPNNFTVTGTTAAQGYAPANEVVTIHTAEGYTITSASYTPAGGSATTINPVEGVWSFTMPAANTTVSATRVVNTYTVHFDANATNGIDATGTMEDMDFTYGQAQNLTANDFERTGYNFTGWNTAADGSGDAYTDGQNVNNLTNVLNGVVTLYAQWSIIPWQGNGTSENDPYIIIYASQLVKLSEDVNGGNSYPNKFFKLGNDIDMNGVAFDGIGYSNFRSFIGTFDGDGKTVSNVIVNKSEQDYVGFFGNVRSGGTVKNLILDGVSIAGDTRVGALVGSGYNCSIENCLVMNSSVTCANLTFTGVICGYPDGATLTDNHYRNCTLTKGNNTSTINIGIGSFSSGSSDVDGARSIHTLALPEHVTASSADMLTYDNVTYYASNVEVTLTPASGITLADVTVNGVAATHQQDETWTFTMPATDATVTCTSSVPYIDADGNQQTCSSYTVIESSDNSVALGTDGQDGWYVVSGNVTITGQLWLKGTNNHLILCDGASLTINHAMQNAVGFYVANDNLYIYGQSAGSGTATITITSPGSHGIQSFGGNITINGGIISATSDMMYGIVASSGNLTINGGSVTAHGYYDGIRSGQNIIINGGTVSATNGEGNRSYGISASQDITLGFTNLTDRITASSYKAYNGTLSVKADQALYDGTAVAYSGALNNDQINAIAGKTLEPCFILTLPAHVNATGVISQEGTTAYALAGNEITLEVTEGYEITSGTASFTMPTHNVVSDVTVQAIAYSISYDLAGGSVATPNPTTYTVETPTFTLNNPNKVACNFDGWTGSNGNTPETTVTIAQGSMGDRSYTAQWTQYAYPLTLGTDITASGNVAITYEGTDYFTPGTIITLAYGGTIPEGYRPLYSVNGNAIVGNTFEMPAADVVVEAVLLERYYTYNSTTGELALIWGEYNKDNKWGDDVTNYQVTSVTATDQVSFTGDCSEMFFQFYNCTSIDLSQVNTDECTNMAHMFHQCNRLASLNLSGWNTASVTDMSNMFYGCQDLVSLDVTHFDTGNVTSMSSMFSGCDALESLDVTGFYTGNVTVMGGMFSGCTALQTLDLSSWNTANVTNMGGMFLNNTNLTTIYAGAGWSTENANPADGMFYGCTSLVGGNGTAYDLSYINLDYACIDRPGEPGYLTGVFTLTLPDDVTMTTTPTLVHGDVNLYAAGTAITLSYSGEVPEGYGPIYSVNGTAIQGNTFAMPFEEATVTVEVQQLRYIFNSTTGELALIWGEFNKDNKWGADVPADAVLSVTATDEVSFTGDCSSLFRDFTNCTSMDLSQVKTDDCTNMSYMFGSCLALTTLDVSNFNTANVTDMSNMFAVCQSLESLDVSNWNTASVTDMHGMFIYCSALESLDILNFDIGKVTDMSNMFNSCSGLKSLDLSNWNTAAVITMNNMFIYCSALESLDLSGWANSSVTDMTNMFLNCSSLETLDVSNWNTASVTNMSNMFNSCSGLTTLDLSNWNTASVTNMYAMFVNCSNLTTIYAGSGWNTENVTYSGSMFVNCASLVGGNGTTYDQNHTNGDYAHIDGGPSNPGYLSAIPLDPVEYIDADGQTAYCQYYTILNGSTDYIDYGEDDVEAWYVVDHDVTYSDGLYFNGPTNLILVDGATLTLNDETEGNGYMSCIDRLTIYVQSEGTGAITAVNSGIYVYGDLIIHGGHITSSSDNSQAYLYSDGDMTINGGAISIETSNYSCIYTYGLLTVNDGTLNAVVTEEDNGYDVIYSEEDVVINGGNITVTNQGYGRGIVGDNVTINGGCVKVYIVEDYGYSGIGVDWWEGEVITLGWTDPSDLIMSQGGYDTYQLSIAPGQAFTDGEGNYFLGTYYNWDEIAALAGKTLRPFTNLDETFHITYVTNGGTLPDGYPTTYTFDETVELPVPTKENNAFAGWFDNAEFEGSPVTEIVAGTTLGDKTFYAKWMPANTWVEYLDADGQQQRVYATVLHGIETELPGGVYTIVDDDVYFDKLTFTGNTTIILPDYKRLYVEVWGKGTNDDENGLFVNGDLTIYGQEFGDGLLNSLNVQISGDVAIYGGRLDIGILSANNGSGTITLSWTGLGNQIRTGYQGNVVLAKAFIDDYGNIYEAGPVEDVTTINGQWLYPFITETEVSYLDENGVLQTVTATVLYGGEEAEYPGGVYTVLDMVIRGQAYYDRLHFTDDATIIIPDWCSFGVAATKEDNEYWLHVEGDLTIYGQEYGNGQCIFSNVTVNGDVNVYGGWVVLYNISANAINLSWTSIQNEHMVNPTQGTTVNLLKDFMYYDDDNNRHVINAQQNVDITTIAERYLKPYAETIDVSYIDENGDTHTENATVLFGDETNLDGGTYTIINYTSFSQAVSFSGNTKLIIPDGIEVYGYYQGGGINLNVTGDLAIYGQENRSGTVLYINASVSGAVTVSNVRVIYSFINSESDILIAGGEQNYGQLSTNGIITLGYLTFNDQIFCYDYEGTVAIREGLTMINDGNGKTYTGTLTSNQVAEIESQYLYPYLTPINLDVAGYGESDGGWVLIASPIAGSIYADNVTNLIGGMTPSGQYHYDLYRFNQSAELEWENYHQNNTTNNPFMLENGKGYLYANKYDVTLEFGGAVYLPASKEVALDYDANATFAGWNLVGNPFNAPATLDKSYYKMNPEGTGLVAEAVSGNTTIDAFTGVMVQANGEDETVLFTKSNAKGQQETGFGTLQIALTEAGNRGNALLDNAIVSFNEGDELGKFYFGTQDANIYIPKNHKEYAIAYAGNQTEMPLNFEAHENGEYTLTISESLNSKFSILNLIDNLTGASIDLLQTPSYTFTAHTSDYESRFRLVFAEDNLDNNDDFAFIDANGNIIINGIDGHATIQLIDLLGHVLITSDVHSDFSLPTSDFPGGMYLLRLINGDNVKTQKIVVR